MGANYHRGTPIAPWIVAICLVCVTQASVATRLGAQSTELPVITTIKELRALSQDEGDRGYPVKISGIVTHVDEQDNHSLIVHDGKLGQFVMLPAKPESAGSWLDLRRGDVVEIIGQTARGGFAPNVVPTMVRTVGRSELPTPKWLPFASMLTGRHDCEYVEITGVVLRAWQSSNPLVRTLFADVAFDEGVVRAAFWGQKPEELARLIDARVRLRGNVGTIFGSTGQLRGVSLFVGPTSDAVILDPAPDPFTLPARSIRSVYNYSTAGEVNRRIRVRGIVTGYVAGRAVDVDDFTTNAPFRFVRHVVYVDDGTGSTRVETEQPLNVAPGAMVDVAGFPTVTPGKPILTNAVLKVLGQGHLTTPTDLDSKALLTPDNDAVLVRTEGYLQSILASPQQRALIIKVGDTAFDATLAYDGTTPGTLESIRPGSLISVTGVYSYQWGPPPSFGLVLRSPGDVSLILASPWWTMRHTAVMLAMLTVLVSAGGLWMRSSARRKQQEYQAVLNERTRLGRELHDTLEQGLAGIALQLEAVEGSLNTSPEAARQSLDVAREMLRYSQEEARRSVKDLRSQALESQDLAGALTDLARQMTRGTRALADVRIEGTPRRLDASDEHHLLRIGLEALTNAIKHSAARTIEIVLTFKPDFVELVVSDDGCGLELAARERPGSHFGFMGIRERVDKLRGTLDVDSRPGGGMRLSVSVPAGAPPRPTSNDQIMGESWRTS